MKKKIKLLLVDDDEIDQIAFKRQVKKENLPFDYTITETVKEAKKFLTNENFDVAVIDYMLEDGTAFDLFNEVSETPFIIVTSLGSEEIAVKAIKKGAYDYLIKDSKSKYLQILPITIDRAIEKKINEEAIKMYQNKLEYLVDLRTKELINKINKLNKADNEIKNLQNQLTQSQKMEAIGTLAGGLAHDFNNILSAIIGTISLIKYKYKKKKNVEKEEIKNHLSVVESSCRRATDLVNNLLTLSCKQNLSLKPVEVKKIVKNVIKLCENSIDKSVTLSSKFIEEEEKIYADFNQIIQVLLNICINSSHAMTIMKKEGEKWGGELNILIKEIFADNNFCQLHIEAEEKNYILISISDSGVGISSNNLSKIFNPFFTTKEKGTGTGLGLSRTYSIIKQHDGFIEVYSEVDEGSTFNIYLPKYENVEISLENIKKSTDNLIKGEGTILVIEDEKIIRNNSKVILNEFGFNVLLAKNGKEGIEIFKKRYNDIIFVLLDLVLPKMDGKTVFKNLKNINPDVKVLLSSGLNKDIRISQMLEKGVITFLHKPYTFQSLSDAIRQILDIQD